MKGLTAGDQNPQGLWIALHGVGSASESGVPLRSWRLPVPVPVCVCLCVFARRQVRRAGRRQTGLCESNEVVKEHR